MKPKTPASHSASSRPRLAGTAPPQKPTSTAHCPAAASCLIRSAAGSVVGGIELSGMSSRVVTPPAAAARVAVANPSHSVRPGSLTCTWVSTSPGISTSSAASRTSVRRARLAAGAGASYAATRSTRPSATHTDAGRQPSGVSTRSARSTRSTSLMAGTLCGGVLRGAPGRSRTCDLSLRRRLLYPLSYWGVRRPRGRSSADILPRAGRLSRLWRSVRPGGVGPAGPGVGLSATRA